MSTSLFRYSKIDQSSSVIVKQRTSEIKSLMRKTAQGIVEIGHKLIEVKEELPHGEFGNWLDAEFGWSYYTARRFMNVASSFKSCNLQDLQIGTSALYMLAEPSTPEEAREEAMERAMKEPITHSDAKEITDRHKSNGSGLDDPKNFEREDDGGYDIDDTEDKNTIRRDVFGRKVDVVDSETGEVLESEDEALPKSRGIGVEKAYDAIAKLKQIPPNDGLKQRAYDIVIQWINTNR